MNNNFEKNIKILNATLLFGILIILAFLLLQVVIHNNINKTIFTYSIYKDINEWKIHHPEANHWILYNDSSLDKNFDKWEFADYLGYFELIYSLEKKNEIDKTVVYELLSNELESSYESNNFEMKKIFEKARKEDNDPTYWVGVESLYKEFMKQRKYIKK